MDKSESYNILAEHLAKFTSYAELVPHVESRHVKHFTQRGASGTVYHGEISFYWDERNKHDIRVIGSVDYNRAGSSNSLSQVILVSPPKEVMA